VAAATSTTARVDFVEITGCPVCDMEAGGWILMFRVLNRKARWPIGANGACRRGQEKSLAAGSTERRLLLGMILGCTSAR